MDTVDFDDIPALLDAIESLMIKTFNLETEVERLTRDRDSWKTHANAVQSNLHRNAQELTALRSRHAKLVAALIAIQLRPCGCTDLYSRGHSSECHIAIAYATLLEETPE